VATVEVPEFTDGDSAGSDRADTVCVGTAAELPLFNMFNTLPVLQLINQGRLRLVYVLGLALLAGYGLDALAANPPTRFQASRRLLIAQSALAIISLILIGSAYAGIALHAHPLGSYGGR
jgi:hypothetical protein